MKTFSAKNEEVERDWYLVDATGKTLGRLATDIARNPLGRKMFSKLKVFAGAQHDHEAQQPIPLEISA